MRKIKTIQYESFEKTHRFSILRLPKNFQEKRVKIKRQPMRFVPKTIRFSSDSASSEGNFELYTRIDGSRAHLSHYVVTNFSLFNPLVMLYAACRYQTSKLFLAIVVNRARLAPSCKWLIPKYCSTI